jgi:hypothetical protein
LAYGTATETACELESPSSGEQISTTYLGGCVVTQQTCKTHAMSLVTWWEEQKDH